jgi:hypothetical protein
MQPKPPRTHRRPTNNRDCGGRLELLSLGHDYQTDIVEIAIPDLRGVPATDDEWYSLLYALVEGAGERLEISRDDIDGALTRDSDGGRSIAIFDTVPGGAGAARLIAERIANVFDAAHRRVATCECGEETSCYACLRGYRNGTLHDRLTRRGALLLLNHLGLDSRPVATQDAVATGTGSYEHGAVAAVVSPGPESWQGMLDLALSDPERTLIEHLQSAATSLPIQGFEFDDGGLAVLAWPDRRIAVAEDPIAVDRLTAAHPGWTFDTLDDADAADRLVELLRSDAAA